MNAATFIITVCVVVAAACTAIYFKDEADHAQARYETEHTANQALQAQVDMQARVADKVDGLEGQIRGVADRVQAGNVDTQKKLQEAEDAASKAPVPVMVHGDCRMPRGSIR